MFLYPNKPIQINSSTVVPKNYIVQVKKNGWRVIIECDGKKVVVYNRMGQLIGRGNQDDWQFLKKVLPSPFLLDGELIGTRQSGNNLFNIAIWDAPIIDGKDLSKSAYYSRYVFLKELLRPSRLQHKEDTYENYGTTLVATNNNFNLLLCNEYNIFDADNLLTDLKIEDYVCKKNNSLPVNEGLVFKDPSAINLWSKISTSENISQLKIKLRRM